MGADADVPVCEEVQPLCKSVVTTFLSPELPELNVVAMVELQASLYQGIRPFSVAEETLRVQMELV